MERFVVECAVRASLIALATGAGLSLARVKAAAVRHSAWTGVLIVMMLLPIWQLSGLHVSWRVLPPLPSPVHVSVMVPPPISPPDTLRSHTVHSVSPVGEGARRWSFSTLLAVVYLFGAAALLFRLLVGTLRARRLVDSAEYRDGRLTSSRCAAPITVGWLKPKVILPDYWGRWPAQQLHAVLAHEAEHSRRRDPLIQWLAALNRSIFWFHPLAWWLDRRLSALAEEACDDAVLAHGHDPQDYSEYLLDIAHYVVNAGSRIRVLGMSMPGTFLQQRLHRMLDRAPIPKTSRLQLALVVITTVASTAGLAAGRLERAARKPAAESSSVTALQREEPVARQVLAPFWIDDDEWHREVQYLITEDETRAYSRLQTERQRREFIASFWSRRDPTPNTVENEFRDEYYRRLRYADSHFADTVRPDLAGYEMDRGRIYVMFGTPDEIERHDETRDTEEIWRYRSVPGLASGLSVQFSAYPQILGAYRIVSPIPVSTFAGVDRPGAPAEAAQHASVQVYPYGFVTMSIPVDFSARGLWVKYELFNHAGIPIDRAEYAPQDPAIPAPILLARLDRGTCETLSNGRSRILPAGFYTLNTAVNGPDAAYNETVRFEVR